MIVLVLVIVLTKLVLNRPIRAEIKFPSKSDSTNLHYFCYERLLTMKVGKGVELLPHVYVL